MWPQRAKLISLSEKRKSLGRNHLGLILAGKSPIPNKPYEQSPLKVGVEVSCFLPFKKKPCTDRLFPKMGECREVLGGGPAPPSKL
jgi:hypothetical protein